MRLARPALTPSNAPSARPTKGWRQAGVPLMAVELACLYDMYSGGPITEITLGTTDG